jgi:hypothetical protein
MYTRSLPLPIANAVVHINTQISFLPPTFDTRLPGKLPLSKGWAGFGNCPLIHSTGAGNIIPLDRVVF